MWKRSRRFQPGEGPSRGLLRDCTTGCGTDGSICGTNPVSTLSRWHGAMTASSVSIQTCGRVEVAGAQWEKHVLSDFLSKLNKRTRLHDQNTPQTLSALSDVSKVVVVSSVTSLESIKLSKNWHNIFDIQNWLAFFLNTIYDISNYKSQKASCSVTHETLIPPNTSFKSKQCGLFNFGTRRNLFEWIFQFKNESGPSCTLWCSIITHIIINLM